MTAVRAALAALLTVGQPTVGPAAFTESATKHWVFPPSGIRVSPPNMEECYVTIDFWGSESYFMTNEELEEERRKEEEKKTEKGRKPDEEKPRPPTFDRRRIRPPAPQPLEPGSPNHVALMNLQNLLTYMFTSRDMRNKTSNACAVVGAPIALRFVLNDPNVIGGVAIKRTNLVIIDLGDIEKHIRSATVDAPPGTSAEAIANALSLATSSYLMAMIAHELDHLREVLEGLLRGAHADPGYGAPEGDLAGGAVRDQNLVLHELGIFSYREQYSTHTSDGKVVIQHIVNGIKVNFDPASSMEPTAAVAGADAHRFVSADDQLLDTIEDSCCGCNSACPVLTDTTAENPELKRMQDLAHDYGFDGELLVSYDMGPFRIEAEPPRFEVNPDDLKVAQPEAIESAPKAADTQVMGASAVLKYANTQIVVARNDTSPPGGVARFFGRQAMQSPWAARSHELRFEQRAGRTPPMTAVFRSLGRSSGTAFQMEIVNGTQEAIRALGAGFLLEPVAKVRRQDAERQLARIKGRRQSIAIDAYCMEFTKAPPALDMIYRIMPRDGAKTFRAVGPIMVASKMLLEAGFLRPDSDPEEYFHSIRQWAIWSEAEGWKTQEAFANAFLGYARKNYASAGRQWTPQVEAAVKRVIPGRWRDIEAVLAERDILLMR